MGLQHFGKVNDFYTWLYEISNLKCDKNKSLMVNEINASTE